MSQLTDDDAARVAEVRHVLERCVGTYQSCALSPQDAADWLAALAAAESERDWLRARVAEATPLAERLVPVVADLEARLAALAALEQAARAWAQHRAIARDPKTTPDAYWANIRAMVKAKRVLDTAVANLAAPLGETGESDAAV